MDLINEIERIHKKLTEKNAQLLSAQELDEEKKKLIDASKECFRKPDIYSDKDLSRIKTILRALTELSLNLSHKSLENLNTSESFQAFKEIDLNTNRLNCLSGFKNCQFLMILNLSRNKIANLSQDMFQDCVQLEDLDLSHNKLEILPSNIFNKCSQLTHLNLKNNIIKNLHESTFKHNSQLAYLDLSNNYLKDIECGLFRNCKYLKYLDLGHNRLNLYLEIFDDCKELNFLCLSHNKLKNLTRGIFIMLGQLIRLNLSNNKLIFLEKDLFINCFKLQHLDLKKNSLQKLDENTFSFCPLLQSLDLRYNRLNHLEKRILNYKNLYSLAQLHSKHKMKHSCKDFFDFFATKQIEDYNWLFELNTCESLIKKLFKNEMDENKKYNRENFHNPFFIVEETDHNENTLLHLLVKYNEIEALDHYLDHLLSFSDTIDYIELKNRKYETALDIAVRLGNSEAVYMINTFHLKKKLSDKFWMKPMRTEFKRKIRPNKCDIRIDLSCIIFYLVDYFQLKNPKPYKKQITNLIFQGGSTKALSYMGALEKCLNEKLFSFENIKRVGGSSAGSMTALLIALGFSLNEIKEIMFKQDFKKELLDDEACAIQILKNSKGLSAYDYIKAGLKVYKRYKENKISFSGLKLREYIESFVEKKLGSNATFQDLHYRVMCRNSGENFKHLFVTGTELITKRFEVFSHIHTPNMIISDAVRISCGIPIFFQPHAFWIRDSDNQRVIDPERKNTMFVDGGIAKNFPIDMFDTFYRKKNIEYYHINTQTLGFRIVVEDKQTKKPIENIRYIFNKCTHICEESNLFYHRDNNTERTVQINMPIVDSINFDLSSENKMELIEFGRNAKLPPH